MENGLYDRIKMLCDKNNITLSRLEQDCGFANATIDKWKNTSTPKADKIKVIAQYFNVSTDYLLGMTDIPSSVESMMGDDDFISLQRARSKMSPKENQKMMQMLRLAFDYAFQDESH